MAVCHHHADPEACPYCTAERTAQATHAGLTATPSRVFIAGENRTREDVERLRAEAERQYDLEQRLQAARASGDQSAIAALELEESAFRSDLSADEERRRTDAAIRAANRQLDERNRYVKADATPVNGYPARLRELEKLARETAELAREVRHHYHEPAPTRKPAADPRFVLRNRLYDFGVFLFTGRIGTELPSYSEDMLQRAADLFLAGLSPELIPGWTRDDAETPI